MRFSIACIFFASILLAGLPAARAADAPAGSAAEFDVLPAELDGGPKTQMLHRYLNALNVEALDRRTVEYEKIIVSFAVVTPAPETKARPVQ